ncbi:hypothetical protein N566_20400 [Streptomycetaceae bacterium MP113-05]|nr:hypothetical protein N566_20400 [Streptomycetaceae bacterium MP113-05]
MSTAPPAAPPLVSGRIRALILLAASLMLVPVLLGGNAGPAHADQNAPGGARPAPGDAWAGMTIEAHEGRQDAARGALLAPSGPQGIDVSHHQGTINWSNVRGAGVRWAYMKATEGTSFTDGQFDRNYTRSYQQGVIRGAYHFALPNASSGASQAQFFHNNGGGWSADGKTLPPMLDLEYNPYGASCYGKSDSGMVQWIRSFSNKIKNLSGRYPVIYTTRDWWVSCTGNSGAFNSTSPLMIARWSSSPTPLPNWPAWTMWQYTSSGHVNGVGGNVDRDVFNGSLSRLRAFARCTNENPCRVG